jgi:hypothetical protein
LAELSTSHKTQKGLRCAGFFFAPSLSAFVVSKKDKDCKKQTLFTIRHRAKATSWASYLAEVNLQISRAEAFVADGIVQPLQPLAGEKPHKIRKK